MDGTAACSKSWEDCRASLEVAFEYQPCPGLGWKLCGQLHFVVSGGWVMLFWMRGWMATVKFKA